MVTMSQRWMQVSGVPGNHGVAGARLEAMTPSRSGSAPVRWGLLGASRIAVREYLPALRAEGGGKPIVVGARDGSRAASYAAEHGIESSVQGYRAVIENPDVDAVYVALPNDLHIRWAAAAAEAGKAVLCEKPLGMDEDEVRGLVKRGGASALIWEAMVFPFHPQTQLLADLVDNELGGVTSIRADFSFVLDNPSDFRWDPAHGGGALYDIGCYGVRLCRLLCGAEAESAQASSTRTDRGIDLRTTTTLRFPGERLGHVTASFIDPPDTTATIIGPMGRIAVSNPYHPGPGDTIEIAVNGQPSRSMPAPAGTSFEYGLHHIHRVLRGEEGPQNLADPESLRQAHTMDMVRAAAIA